MKQRHFLKLGYVGAFLLVVASMIYVACNVKNPSSEQSDDSTIAVLNQATPTNFETIKPELKKLLTYLQRNPQIITPAVLVKAVERYATVKDLGLVDKFPVEFPLNDGNTFEVYIELFDGSVGNGSSIEDTDVYFTLDIDRYPEDAEVVDPDNVKNFKAYVAATEHNKRKGLYTGDENRRQLAIDSTTQKVNYLLFFIGGEERFSRENEKRQYQSWLNSRSGLAKAQSNPSTIYYWVSFIHVSLDQNTGNDEFELYYANQGGTETPFQATTAWRFDGNVHQDATGNYPYFPDINGPGSYVLSPPNYIALEILTPDSPLGFNLSAIEDDCTAGVHKNNHTGGGFTQQIFWADFIDTKIPVSGYFRWTILDDCFNDDDIYSHSGTVSFGNAAECVYSVPPNSHVILFLRKGTIDQAINDWYHVPCL